MWLNDTFKHSDYKVLDSIPFYFCTMCKATSGRYFNSKHRLRLEYYKHASGQKYIHECFCQTYVLTGQDTLYEVMILLQPFLY